MVIQTTIIALTRSQGPDIFKQMSVYRIVKEHNPVCSKDIYV